MAFIRACVPAVRVIKIGLLFNSVYLIYTLLYILYIIDHFPYIIIYVDFRAAYSGYYYTVITIYMITDRLQIPTHASRQTFWVARVFFPYGALSGPVRTGSAVSGSLTNTLSGAKHGGHHHHQERALALTSLRRQILRYLLEGIYICTNEGLILLLYDMIFYLFYE